MKIWKLFVLFIGFAFSAHAQELNLDAFLDKANLATAEYTKTFKNLTAEELRTLDYFRKDDSLEDSRKIRSIFVVYQSPKNNLIAEYRNIVEFNGKKVERSDDDIADFFGKLSKAGSSDEEVARLRKEGNRFDGKSHSYGMTLLQAFFLNRYFRPSFEFRVAGKEQIEGRDAIIIEYNQIAACARIKANATDEEKKKEPYGITFDTELPSSFRPTNPRLQGKIWLDAETARLWRNEFTVSIQPAFLSKPAVSANFFYEYQSSEFGILLPKKFSMIGYRFSGKSEKDMTKSKAFTKTYEYSKFSKPESEIKGTRTGN
ncbi:MAG: hypothetical protein ABL999_16750 [Pyrinomonadaceae bacterium]